MTFGCLGCVVPQGDKTVCHPAGTTDGYPQGQHISDTFLQLRHLRGGLGSELNKASLLDEWLFPSSADNEILHGSCVAHWGPFPLLHSQRSATDMRLLPEPSLPGQFL